MLVMERAQIALHPEWREKLETEYVASHFEEFFENGVIGGKAVLTLTMLNAITAT